MKQSYTDLLSKASAWIKEHKNEYICELQRLARIPSGISK